MKGLHASRLPSHSRLIDDHGVSSLHAEKPSLRSQVLFPSDLDIAAHGRTRTTGDVRNVVTRLHREQNSGGSLRQPAQQVVPGSIALRFRHRTLTEIVF